nr:phage tail assembly protein [Campylobacter hyointestinalis]
MRRDFSIYQVKKHRQIYACGYSKSKLYHKRYILYFKTILKMISNLTGLSSDELDELSMKDYAKLQKGLQDFL